MASRHALGAGPAPVNLGSTAHFAILSGAAIATTGGGIINGDVGASPIAGAAIGIPATQVNGTIYEDDASGPAGAVVAPALLAAAQNDLTTAYNDAAGRMPIPTGYFLDPGLTPGSADLSGMNLAPGLYKFTSTAAIASADVTLTGGPNDVWIFQIGTTLVVSDGIHVTLAGGAQARNIFWQVGTSATLGTTSVFEGTILANQAITMNTGSTMNGRALASTAAVTFNGTGGSLPTPEAPLFTNIVRSSASATVMIQTTPYFLLTLQASPTLLPANWTIIATNFPSTNLWTFIDTTATATVPQRFYRAFLTVP